MVFENFLALFTESFCDEIFKTEIDFFFRLFVFTLCKAVTQSNLKFSHQMIRLVFLSLWCWFAKGFSVYWFNYKVRKLFCYSRDSELSSLTIAHWMIFDEKVKQFSPRDSSHFSSLFDALLRSIFFFLRLRLPRGVFCGIFSMNEVERGRDWEIRHVVQKKSRISRTRCDLRLGDKKSFWHWTWMRFVLIKSFETLFLMRQILLS